MLIEYFGKHLGETPRSSSPQVKDGSGCNRASKFTAIGTIMMRRKRGVDMSASTGW